MVVEMDRPDIVHYFWANLVPTLWLYLGDWPQSGAEKGIGDPNAKLHGMSLGTAAPSA